ncbi:MAG: hypothetical protein K6A96_09630 [Prevotella sp.]|nr:hypothetical protein [Prevotella sp.]
MKKEVYCIIVTLWLSTLAVVGEMYLLGVDVIPISVILAGLITGSLYVIYDMKYKGREKNSMPTGTKDLFRLVTLLIVVLGSSFLFLALKYIPDEYALRVYLAGGVWLVLILLAAWVHFHMWEIEVREH